MSDYLLLYKARHIDEFLGSLAAEDLKSEVAGEARTVERRVQRAVGRLVHVDAAPRKDVRIAPYGLRLRLGKRQVLLVAVVFAFYILHQHTPIPLAGLHHLVVTQLRLQVHTDFRVRVKILFHFIGFWAVRTICLAHSVR